jgi:enoyl-CoA hydratase
MDLILTGRPVTAGEAASMGLVNRVVSPGNALDAAIELAQEITRHPQRCMRSDRRSAIEQWGMTEEDAMRNELTLGLQTIASGETISGATRFREGVGRHGSFDDES